MNAEFHKFLRQSHIFALRLLLLRDKMKLNDIIADLREAKFKKPIVMYHGTSSKFTKSILKNGMDVDAKTKTWEDDADASIHSPSRKSLHGSYWTSDLRTATSSANRTKKKVGGNSLLVIANIAVQSALADEDDVTFVTKNAFNNTIKNMFGVMPDAIHAWIGMWFDDALKTNFLVKFSDTLHNNLTENPNKPINAKMLEQVATAYVDRLLSHTIAMGQSPFKRLRDIPEYDQLPVTESERLYLKARDKLSSYYRESAQDETRFSHTLRYPENVGFSGASKITHLLEISEDDIIDIKYGNRDTLSEKFLSDWKSKIGKIEFSN